MKVLLAFVVGVVVSRPLWSALVWLWHDGGVGCALLDHDPNWNSLMYGYGNDGRGVCWRCRGPLISEADAQAAARRAAANTESASVVLAVDRSRSSPANAVTQPPIGTPPEDTTPHA